MIFFLEAPVSLCRWCRQLYLTRRDRARYGNPPDPEKIRQVARRAREQQVRDLVQECFNRIIACAKGGMGAAGVPSWNLDQAVPDTAADVVRAAGFTVTVKTDGMIGGCMIIIEWFASEELVALAVELKTRLMDEFPSSISKVGEVGEPWLLVDGQRLTGKDLTAHHASSRSGSYHCVRCGGPLAQDRYPCHHCGHVPI